MNYYSAIQKKNEIMKCPNKYIKLEIVILSKVTQTQKDKCCRLSSCFESPGMVHEGQEIIKGQWKKEL